MSSNSVPEEIVDGEELVDDLDETLEVTPYIYSITAYGADYPVDSLVKRIDSGDIVVPRFSWPPDERSEIVGFQREYVWPRTKSDRFIESLLLGLPVPGVFLVREPTDRFLVLDGHQRLHTLRSFYEGVIHGQEYRLDGVEERFHDKRYQDLDVDDRRRLDDSIIHATVIRQDEPSEDQSSVYMIFERLNTGGVNLQPQEIRVALYHGEFVRVLRDGPGVRRSNEEPELPKGSASLAVDRVGPAASERSYCSAGANGRSSSTGSRRAPATIFVGTSSRHSGCWRRICSEWTMPACGRRSRAAR